MKHPDLNASGSSKFLTGFADFGAMDANGRSGRDVGNDVGRCKAMPPVLWLLLAVDDVVCEQARGDDLAGTWRFCCLAVKGAGSEEALKVAVAEHDANVNQRKQAYSTSIKRI